MEQVKIISTNAVASLDTATPIAKSEPTPSETVTPVAPSEPTPSEPTPSEPITPSEPTPSEPTPSEPTPSEPTPSEPTPSEPTPSEPTPSDPYESLGLKGDEKFKKIVEAYKGNKLKEYLHVATADYDSMTPEDLFRIDLQNQYPNMSREKIEVLLQNKMENDYGFDDDPNSVGSIRKEADAQKIRDGLKLKQSEYELPTFEGDRQSEQQQAEQQHQIQEFTNFYNSNPFITEFEKNYLLPIGNGENAMNFEVDKSIDLRKITFQPNSFYEMFHDKATGKINLAKWAKVVSYAHNMEKMEQALIEHGKSLGKKAFHDELKGVPARQEEAAPKPESNVKIVGWR